MRFEKTLLKIWLLFFIASVLWIIIFPEPEYVPPPPRDPSPVKGFWDQMREEAIREGRYPQRQGRYRIITREPDESYRDIDIQEGDDDE